MIWYSIAFLVVVIAFIILVARHIAAEHRRSAKWDDLHERSKLFASQLAYLRDAQISREAQLNLSSEPKSR
jgi:hypothetical protein